MRREVGCHQPTIRGRQPPTTIERWHPTYKPRPNLTWRCRIGGHDRDIDRSPIDCRCSGPRCSLCCRGFFQGAITARCRAARVPCAPECRHRLLARRCIAFIGQRLRSMSSNARPKPVAISRCGVRPHNPNSAVRFRGRAITMQKAFASVIVTARSIKFQFV